MPEKRISLNAEDFENLTAGKIIKKEGIKIILKDIGYYRKKY